MRHAAKIIIRAQEHKSAKGLPIADCRLSIEKSQIINRKSKILIPIVFSFTFLALIFPAPAQARVLPRTAELVPPETVLLVDVDNFSQLKGQFEKTYFYKLYKDPAMAAFVDDFKAKWREKIKELDNKIAEAIASADVLPQGRVAFALVLNERPKDAAGPPVLLITQWGQTIDKIKEAVDKMVKKAIEDGLHRKTEDYRGVSIVTMLKELPPIQVQDWSSYKPEHESVPMKTVQPPPTKTSYCFIDDCLIGSTNLDVLKFVIAHIKGATSPTLASDVNYNPTIKAVGPYHDIDFYVNIKQIIKTIIVEDTTGQAQTTIANLGFDNVAAFGGSIGLGRGPASSYRGKAFLKINGAKKGICKMLEVESSVLKAPRFIPASAYSATFLNLNIKKVYTELYNILYSFSPKYAAMMHAMDLPDSPDGEPGVQLKRDVIDHLGSQVVIAQSTRKPFSNSSTPTETLVALAVNNRDALEKSMSLLHSKVIAPNDPAARRELLGHTIYLVSPPKLPFFRPGMTPMQRPADSATPQMPTLAFTITNTHLVWGVESTVEQVIRRLSSTEAVSIASAKWFTSAKLAIPSVVGIAGLEDNAALGELFWWMMKQGSKAKDSSVSMGPNLHLVFSQAGLDLFNFSLLPEFDTVRKYFGLSASYGISRPDGFFFESKHNLPNANR